MIIERPRRPDSAIDALGVALRVLVRPAYLWAPVVVAFVLALPALLVPAIPGGPMTEAEVQAMIQEMISAYVAVLPITIALTLVLGPVANAVMFRLAAQYLDGVPARPFGSGFVDLAWRFFLQLLIFSGLWILWAAILVGLFAIGVLLGQELFFVLVESIVGAIVILAIGIRLSVATVALLAGNGPVESMRASWRLTRGRYRLVLRWTFVPVVIVSGGSYVLGTLIQSLSAGETSGPATVILATILSPLTLVYVIVLVQLHRLLIGFAGAGLPAATPELTESTAAMPFATPVGEIPG